METVKERPILFSTPMVQAILAGQKTMTRRACKPANEASLSYVVCGDIAGTFGDEEGDVLFKSPYGVVGDRLWVKETTINVEDYGWEGTVYLASEEGKNAFEWGYGESDDPDFIEPYKVKKRSSLFMSRSMSRILLEIVNIKIELLNSISEADAMAEGVFTGAIYPPTNYTDEQVLGWKPEHGSNSAIDAFKSLWESINGTGSWAENPWVWVVEFKILEIKK